MIMNKIEALRKTLIKLNDTNVNYDWSWMHTCNCGLLIQSALGISENNLRKEIWMQKMGSPLWSGSVCHGEICSVTGMSTHYIFNSMFKYGFLAKDINELEQLNNPEIIGITGPLNFNKKQDVIAYITAWIEILEEENNTLNKTDSIPETVTEPEKIYITVEIDSKVKDLTKSAMETTLS